MICGSCYMFEIYIGDQSGSSVKTSLVEGGVVAQQRLDRKPETISFDHLKPKKTSLETGIFKNRRSGSGPKCFYFENPRLTHVVEILRNAIFC